MFHDVSMFMGWFIGLNFVKAGPTAYLLANACGVFNMNLSFLSYSELLLGNLPVLRENRY